MAILSKDQAYDVLKKIVGYSTADHCSISLGGSNNGNIRYARNTVSTAGMESNISLAVTAAFGKKTGTATTNELDDQSLRAVVKRAEELAKLSPENPEYMEPLGPREFDKANTFYESTAAITPEFRAEATRKSIEYIKKKGLVGAGFIEDGYGFSSIMNSKGLFAYNKSSSLDFTLTVRTKDGTGSGWVSRDVNDLKYFDIEEATSIALEKAYMSANAKAIEPGKYTVVLEPAAVSGLVGNMFYSMGARSADEGRSFLSKEGGGTKLGEKIVDERITIYSDPQNEMVPGGTWSGSGLPIEKRTWIENGVVKNLFYSRYWAEKQGKEPVPFPSNGIIKGGTASIDDLVADTERGILVTRFWYIRSVDPQTLLYTGLTRDGTFYIENGKIKHPIKNMRFNESPIIMLNNLDKLGQPMRTGGNLIPPMKINDFTFTSLSDAI
ncbi:MAG: TldD/PmbA family protein [Saprospiraceae bacterium]|nr:TldD/PmbA family protein [Saprospiraceae bacterium]